MRLQTYDPPMAIEQLVFEVDPEHLARWLEIDHEIWTAGLAECEGFAGKEAWLHGDRPGEVTMVIYWTSLECFESVDRAWIARIDEAFTRAVGDVEWKLIKVKHHEDQYFKVNECVL